MIIGMFQNFVVETCFHFLYIRHSNLLMEFLFFQRFFYSSFFCLLLEQGKTNVSFVFIKNSIRKNERFTVHKIISVLCVRNGMISASSVSNNTARKEMSISEQFLHTVIECFMLVMVVVSRNSFITLGCVNIRSRRSHDQTAASCGAVG